MEEINIKRVNHAYLKVTCEPGIAYELNEYFTFEVPGAKFSPKFKNKVWDGKIRLYSVMSGMIYGGLLKEIDKFAKQRGYQVNYLSNFSADEFSVKEAIDFIKTLNTPFMAHEDQLNAFVHAIRNKRELIISPTGSGKSFIIYLLARYYNIKTLIIVPKISLVTQLYSDFKSYRYDSEKYIHKIYGGEDKNTDKQIIISTWQSIFKQPKEYFEQFGLVIGDEAHLFKAKSLITILTNLVNCQYRFGLTGTLDDTQTHDLVLQGLFGPKRQVVTTAELIEQKRLSKLNIKAIVLNYSNTEKQKIKKADYMKEINYLISNDARNRYIKNLVLSLKGNTLLLFQYVEKHGEILYNMIKESCDSRKVFFIHGGVDVDIRDQIRPIVEKENDAIIVASFGTYSTGINIVNLHNIVFASPSKSKIRNLQSIGRALRKSGEKESATLYDIADDLTWNNKKNNTLLHFISRIETYNKEEFPYKIYSVNLKD